MPETVTASSAPPPAAQRPMSPGTYLRKRREAAGFTVDMVALTAGRDPAAQAQLRNAVLMLENDQARLPHTVRWLGGVFRFDLSVYEQLAVIAADPHGDVPVPQVCRQCGCSWNDACVDPESGPCAWANLAGDLCSHCARPVPAPSGEAADAA